MYMHVVVLFHAKSTHQMPTLFAQIDAHTVFKQDWDVLMLEQWGAADNEFAVLSTYPTNYKDLYKNSNNHWEMPHLCSAVVGTGGGAVHNNQVRLFLFLFLFFLAVGHSLSARLAMINTALLRRQESICASPYLSVC
jgi:hypothetical protein